MPLLAYPNVSEGRDTEAIARDCRRVRRRDCSTSTPTPTTIAARTRSRASRAARRGRGRAGRPRRSSLIRIDEHEGVHPRVGAVDVAPIIYLDDADRGAACAEALVLADRLAERS